MKKVLYFLLVVCVSIKAPNVIDNLASAFQNISIQKSEKDSYLLLGPKLWRHPNVIIDKNENSNIYQFEVIDQTSIEEGRNQCGYHSQRNLLYMVDMIKSPFKDFMTLYGQMIDEERFLDWNKAVAEIVGCERKEIHNIITQKQLQEISKKEPSSFPENVVDTRIFHGDFFYDTSKFWKEKIQQYEKDVNGKKIRVARAFEGFFPTFYQDQYVWFFNDTQNLDNFILPIRLDINNSGISHATALLLHKYNKELEYFFADSWKNQKFSTSSNGYINSIINGIVDLFSLSSEAFIQNIIRVQSILLMDRTLLNGKVFMWTNVLTFYEISEQKSFATNDFYKKFYQKSVNDVMKIIAKDFEKNKKKIEKNLGKFISIDFEQRFEKFENYLKGFLG